MWGGGGVEWGMVGEEEQGGTGGEEEGGRVGGREAVGGIRCVGRGGPTG